MKKPTTLIDAIPPEQVNVSTVPPMIVQRQDALAKFRKAIAKDDSLKTHVEHFLDVVKLLEENFASWTFRDIVTQARAFDIQIEVLQELWEKYASTMIALRRLDVIQGAYDEPIYIRV